MQVLLVCTVFDVSSHRVINCNRMFLYHISNLLLLLANVVLFQDLKIEVKILGLGRQKLGLIKVRFTLSRIGIPYKLL